MSDEIVALKAEVAELRATVAALTARLEAGAPAPAVDRAASEPSHSRRDLLKLAGGVAAGAAGGLLVSAGPAAAASNTALTPGAQATPDAGTTPTSGIDYSGSGPYFGATPHPVFSVTDTADANNVSAAIVGAALNNAGVGVAGFGPIYDLWAGGSGVIGIVPFTALGPPNTGQWINGDIIEDAAGNLFVCVATGAPGTWRKLAGPAAAGAFHAISPTRVYDSRGGGGKLADGAERNVSVAGPNAGNPAVPAGATAVSVTLTVTDTEGAGGFLGVRPAGTPYAGTSSINWFGPNQNIATTVISGLGGDRLLTVHGGAASTNFLIDVTGYYR